MIYCVKCGRKTAEVGVKAGTARNGTRMLRGQCKVCGTRKCQFVSEATYQNYRR